ncbi:MAG: hypothetical protein IJW75_03665 [Alphaproteobacteria bacterium]|nr:hypothetical protein [Alphaproteobacteria bacterium]
MSIVAKLDEINENHYIGENKTVNPSSLLEATAQMFHSEKIYGGSTKDDVVPSPALVRLAENKNANMNVKSSDYGR